MYFYEKVSEIAVGVLLLHVIGNCCVIYEWPLGVVRGMVSLIDRPLNTGTGGFLAIFVD